MRFRLILVAMLGLAGCASDGPGLFFRADRDRHEVIADPEFLQQYAVTRGFSLGRPRGVKVTPDGTAVLFLRSGPRSFVHDLYEFDTATGKERQLLTAAQILEGAEENLSIDELARRERMRISARGIVSYRISEDGARLLVPLSDRLFVIDRADGRVTELHSDKGFPIDPRLSPDGKWVASVRDKELHVIDVATGEERQVTSGAGGEITNALSEFVAQEEMGRYRGYWWSPDNRMIAYQRTDTSGVERMHILDPMHPEREAHSWPYPRPGQQNATVELGVIPVSGGETIWIRWDKKRYPYLATVKWEENSPLTILVQDREQTEEVLLSVATETGETSTLLVERDEAWINLDRGMPHWLDDGSGFLWTTERNGSWQLELHDRYGKLVAPLTLPSFMLKGLVSCDEKARLVYVSGGHDPTQTHVYLVPLDGGPGEPVRITNRPGYHGFSFGEDHSVYVHSGSTTDGHRFLTVLRSNGETIGELRSVAEDPPFVPNIELTTAGDDPAFHAVLIRPRNFDPKRRYPVIVYVYGGPHGQMVGATPSRYVLQQWLADHGFIVVALDGRGTPSRGRDWERVIKGNLIDAPLSDQVAGLQALGREFPELDLDHVGIYGWSFGGYFSAMAVMQRPDVYHAGIAGAPVSDWRDYDTHYTERYMGLPENNPDGYEASSALTHAPKLDRPLMIIHGTGDDNVYFMHSLKMSNALFRAGKQHEFLALSGFTHMVADPLVTARLNGRIVDFFKKHLMEN